MYYKKLKICLFFVLCLLFLNRVESKPQNVVNIYNWAHAITPEVIQAFEAETGIKVNYDVYDSAEVMEAKLLAGRSGYDVVFATAWPYLARQILSQIYQSLDKALIPNYSKLDQGLLKRMREADPKNAYSVPYLWGTSGFAYNRAKIESIYPGAPTHSYAMLFDPQIVSKFAGCGVFLLDSPTDVFPAVLTYLGLNPNSTRKEDLKRATQVLIAIRPYIKKFQPVSSPQDLLSGDACLVQGWSGELIQARKRGKELNPPTTVDYVIPKEGGTLWIDAMAIPKDAPHVWEAHAFINFLLRPDIMAKLTNALDTANAVPESRKLIKEKIIGDPQIYPSNQVREKLYIDQVQSPEFERLRLREWTRVKIGR